jgi:hypothetical protein
MRNPNKKITFEISGGIGNQLFQYSAAKYFEFHNDLSVIFQKQVKKDIEFTHSEFLSKLFNNLEIYPDKNEPGRFKILRARIDRILARQFETYAKARKVFVAHEVGYVEKEPNFKKQKIVRGYFQSYLYAEHSKNQIFDAINKIETSSWTKNKITEAANVNPIAIHIRRGDYVNQASRYGLLGKEYYLKALSKLSENSKINAVWIFSDGNDSNLESEIGMKHPVTIIRKPPEVNDLDILVIMSKCSFHIIANSTFSWWAAFLSDTTQKVYYPEPWTISGINPKSLIPPDWVDINAEW